MFQFTDWSQDLTGYDLIVCAHNYDPAQIRRRPDVKPTAKLAAYVCWESIPVEPWGDGGSVSARIHARLARPEFLLAEGTGIGYVSGASLGTRCFFSSYPWPKTADGGPRDRWDLALTADRVQEHALAVAHEVPVGWDLFYVDQSRPIPEHLANRYAQHNVPGFITAADRMFNRQLSEGLLETFLAHLRELRSEPILGNTAGWTSRNLDGICIEWGARKPWNPNGMDTVLALGRFQVQANRCSVNGRGCWNVDFAGDKGFDLLGLVMRGDIVGNAPPGPTAAAPTDPAGPDDPEAIGELDR